jgi:NAD(P)-dependent dehydrogenase (short-subunit alcohol dehydrogenase family)
MSDAIRVLVAGAGGGIGSACLELLEAAGHRTFAVDRPDYDITVAGGAEQAVHDAVEALGGLDGVVHAIGMSGRRLGDGPVTEATDDGWTEVMRVNLESVFRLLRAGLPALRRAGGGSFVTIGSVLGQSADRDFLTAAYAASKAALTGLVRTAALEAAPWNVRVNNVAAGLVETPMSARAAHDEHIGRRLAELQPLGGRMLSARAIAGAVVWLLSPGAAGTTGVTLPVDGGWSLR